MNVSGRLIILSFLQYFIWGSWLISLGGYLIVTLGFSGLQVGSIYATMGIASVFMPTLLGIVADRWVNAEKVLGMAHILGSVALICAAQASSFEIMYLFMFFNSMFYMPTIALSNAASFRILSTQGADIVKTFPPIRVWGTVGFILAMWIVDIGQWTLAPTQLYVSAVAGLVLGIYTFTLPACPPLNTKKTSWGLESFVLFKDRKMAVFFIFSMLLGAALQITNTFGEAFLHDFKELYPDSFAVQHPGILMSASQLSEVFFILLVPFFLKRFGIRNVILMSIVAWMLRFAFFGFGNPGDGFILLIASMVIYGMAFDFFNISGALFVKNETEQSITASAQGLFMLMTNGIGAMLGGMASGVVVDYFTNDGFRDWKSIWLTFAAYALVLAVVFPIAFRYKGKTQSPATV